MNGIDLLTDEDREYLLLRCPWQHEIHVVSVGIGNEINIVFHKFALPEKYIPREIDLLVRQFPGYPETGMDMFWSRPDVLLSETKQKPQAADQYETHLGQQWQRWSRHTVWRAGIDTLETFFRSIREHLKA